MRVVSGSARGKTLKKLESEKTRPTAAVVKEAVMSIIQFEIAGANALDLFAGTGQMGIELLSRGANSCVFVDISAEAIKMIKENLQNTNLTDRAKLARTTAEKFLAGNASRYDIIILDPPYNQEIIIDIMPTLIKHTSENAIIICETHKEEQLPTTVAGYSKSKDYIYGSRKINLYQKATV